MSFRVEDLTPEESDLASRGKMCPACKRTEDIQYVGCSFDGINANKAYDCDNCGAEWEGY